MNENLFKLQLYFLKTNSLIGTQYLENFFIFDQTKAKFGFIIYLNLNGKR